MKSRLPDGDILLMKLLLETQQVVVDGVGFETLLEYSRSFYIVFECVVIHGIEAGVCVDVCRVDADGVFIRGLGLGVVVKKILIQIAQAVVWRPRTLVGTNKKKPILFGKP